MKRMWMAAAALAVAPLASAQDVTWKCDFKGTYTETGESEKKPFTWKVTWVEGEKQDKITGTTDEGGVKSKTSGVCNESTCTVDEVYADGTKFFWIGTYSDAETKNENVYVTSFKGTWGESPSDRKSGGAWSAKANCKR